MWFIKKNKLSKWLLAVFYLGTAECTAETTAYPTGSHLQMLTCDHISNSDQDYVLLMMIENFHFAK